ncbi:hypothetical protein MTR67_032221 [Solanum verrucosum]|uniref:Uncharacterized protein n=1 Tax=Solanum verrucosum TaxID=315347 RepID=A0AAF0ZF96_SOLVR|nr:hypothetical protein MTR67_032221 [Solanum verrucosum]
MARGRGRGKSFGRSSPAIHVSILTILMHTIVSPQQGGTTIVETSAQSTTPTISETPPITPNQSSPIGQGLSTQSIPTGRSNPIAKGDLSTQRNSRVHTNTVDANSSSNHSRTFIFISSAGLEPSIICSSFITKSFRNDVDPNGINWKSVSNDVKNGYFGEFKGEKLVQVLYLNMFGKDGHNFGGSDESKKKSETNAKNRRGGREVATGTHTCGSISIGEHRKKLVNLCSSSSIAPSVSQSTSTRNMDVFVKEMITALTNHFLPVIMERVQQVVTPIDNPSLVTPMVLSPSTTNEDEVDSLASSDEGIP